MNRLLVSIALGASLAAASLATASAQMIPSGSYQQSCTNVRVRGDMLTARCNNTSGAQARSSIALNGCRGGDIANSNGQLVCNGGGNGYGRHRDGYNNGNSYGNGNGNGYGRMNGNGYGRGGAMGGSYQQSCQNVQTRGGMITATCPDPNGRMITTSIDGRQCRGADIANRNGRLVCQ